MSNLSVEILAQDQIRAVYPVIREALPHLALPDWVRLARRTLAGRRGGFLVARRDGRPFPCGLFCYRVDNDPLSGQILTAEHFVAVDLLDPDAVLAALAESLEALAHRLGCREVRCVINGTGGRIVRGLVQAGHTEAGKVLRKPLPN